MSCYNCGNYGHKKDKCLRDRPISQTGLGGTQFSPARIAKIKCYNCNELGHYKNDCSKNRINSISKTEFGEPKFCPKIKEQLKLAQEKQLKDEYDLWRSTWFDTSLTIINAEEIKDFIINKVPKYYDIKLECNDINYKIDLHYNNCHISSFNTRYHKWQSGLGKELYNSLTLDDFLLLASKKGTFKSLSYTKCENDLESMIFELKKNGLINVVKAYIKDYEYYIGNVKVMNYRDKEDPVIDVYEDKKEIICKAYDQFKNDGRNSLEDIVSKTYTIEFIYK